MTTVITIRYVFISIYICFCFSKNNFSSSGKSSQTSHVSFQHSDISHRIPLTLNWRRLSYPCVSIAANLHSSPSYSTVQIYFFLRSLLVYRIWQKTNKSLLARVTIYFLLQRFLLFKVILRTFSSVQLLSCIQLCDPMNHSTSDCIKWSVCHLRFHYVYYESCESAKVFSHIIYKWISKQGQSSQVCEMLISNFSSCFQYTSLNRKNNVHIY